MAPSSGESLGQKKEKRKLSHIEVCEVTIEVTIEVCEVTIEVCEVTIEVTIEVCEVPLQLRLE